MTRILLISDTHSYLDPALLKHIKSADEVWHAGDMGSSELSSAIQKHKPFKAVFGNIDGPELRKEFPEISTFLCEKVKVLMIHIGGYPGKYPSKIKSLLKQEKPDLFICGHSHILKVQYDSELKLLHMNPGACGREGFHQIKTALRFEVEGKEIKNLVLIEIGKRSL